MGKFGHLLYTHKLLILNVFLAVFIAVLDPLKLTLIPDTPEVNYYIGVSIMVILFFEFAAIYYLARWIYSFPRNLQRRVPWYIGISFIPRFLVSAGMAFLVLSAMGVLTNSDFFLILIAVYAATKEFWVRAFLLNADREKTKRPSKFKNWAGALMFFIFIAGSYFAMWEVYLLEHRRIMYLFLNPINWGWDILIFAVLITSIEIPYIYEEWIRKKRRSHKVLAFCSILLPTLAFLFCLYRLSYLR